MAQCSADPDKFVFSNGPDADMLLWSLLAMLAIVMSKSLTVGSLLASRLSFLLRFLLLDGT